MTYESSISFICMDRLNILQTIAFRRFNKYFGKKLDKRYNMLFMRLYY